MLRSDVIDFILANRKNGKNECFMWDNEGLEHYINWAFIKNNLLYASSEIGISGVCVAYELPKPFDGSLQSILPYDEEVEECGKQEIVIMDILALNKNSKNAIVSRFQQRFKNWENQKKYVLRSGRVKEITNSYIKKLKSL